MAAIAVLALLCGLSAMNPRAAHAAAGSPWQCWRSGGADNGFGDEAGSVFEQADLYRDEYGVSGLVRADVNAKYAVDYNNAEKWPYPSYFGSLADAVDVRWYDYIVPESQTSRVIQGEGLTGYYHSPSFGLWHALQTPSKNPEDGSSAYGLQPRELWRGSVEYLKERRFDTGNTDKKIVREFRARWINPDNPEGGTITDQAALLQDHRASQFDAVAATQSYAQGGSRVTQGTIAVPANTLNVTFSCPSPGTCTGTSTSGVSNVTGSFNTVEQNSGEYSDFRVADSTRVSGGQTIDVDVSDVPPVTIDEWKEAGRTAYSELGMGDGSADQLVVQIKTRRRERTDFVLSRGDDRGNFLLRAFGENPWTYDAYGKDRNRPLYVRGISTVRHAVETTQKRDPGPNVFHVGYRQPSITPQYAPDAIQRTAGPPGDWTTDLVVWPVNFEDLAWYFFELPGDETAANDTGDDLWRYWLSKDGGQRLVDGGFAGSGAELVDRAVPDVVCTLQGNLVSDGISCVNGTGKASDGTKEIPFPFSWYDGHAGTIGAADGLILVNRGVTRPLGAQADTARNLDEFVFVIGEGSGLVAGGAGAGGDSARRLGVPKDPGFAETYEEEWLNLPGETGEQVRETNPNRSHLLVVAFYEMEELEKASTAEFRLSVDGVDGQEKLKVPERKMRRVVCRMLVHPAGFEPTESRSDGFLAKAAGLVGGAADAVSNPFEQLLAPIREWLKSFFGGLGDTPKELVGTSLSAVCTGAEATETFVAGENRGTAGLYQVDGDLVTVNRTVESRAKGLEDCQAAKKPPKATCDRTELAVGGRCVELPPVRLFVADSFYLSSFTPDVPAASGRPNSKKYVEYRRDRGTAVGALGPRAVDVSGIQVALGRSEEWFDPLVLRSDAESDGVISGLDHRNVGLTEVQIAWDFVSGSRGNLSDIVDGYEVAVAPDPAVNPAPGRDVLYFTVPLYFTGIAEHESEHDKYQAQVKRFERFKVGGLGGNDHWVDGSNAIDYVKWLEHEPRLASRRSANNLGSVRRAHGNQDQVDDFEALKDLLDKLPLAPGYTHSFAVTPYVGVPGEPNFVRGPTSDWLTVDGGSVACLASGRPIAYAGLDGDFNTGDDPSNSPGLDGEYGNADDPKGGNSLRGWADLETIQREVYGCRDNDAAASSATGVGVAAPVFGLLALSVPERCKDIFTGTPAGYTWGNPVVRDAWAFMWILAGMVLFTLLVWHGLKMTYDIWVEPRPDFGLREAVPRFLIATTLAAGSLYLCQLALVLTADLTCYVSERTSITMWSFVVDVVFRFGEGTLEMIKNSFPNFEAAGGVKALLLRVWFILSVGGLALVAFFFLLIMMLKLWFIMLTRLALLAVLIVFSPLAFAMYASPTTAHWTKRWITLFLGTALQQAVMLVVIYIGSYIMVGYAVSGVDVQIWSWLTMAAMTALILALALKVPDIINPGSKGLFSAAGEMLKMAAAAAVVVGTAGAGAIAGGAGAIVAARGAAGAAGAAGAGGLGATSGAAAVGGPGAASAAASGAPAASGVAAGTSSSSGLGARLGQMTQRFAGSDPGTGSTTRNPIRGAVQGAMRGVQMGQRFNIRALDVGTGRSLYKGFSHGDDRQLAIEREQRRAAETSGQYMQKAPNEPPPRRVVPRSRRRREQGA